MDSKKDQKGGEKSTIICPNLEEIRKRSGTS